MKKYIEIFSLQILPKTFVFLFQGLFGYAHMSDTSASKFALVGMMEAVDHELNLAGYDGVITTHVYSASFKSALYNKSRRL